MQELKQPGIALIETRDNVVRALRGFGQCLQPALLHLRRSEGKHTVAVGAIPGFSELFDQFRLECRRDGVLKALGFGVDLMPLHAEDLGEHPFHCLPRPISPHTRNNLSATRL